MSSFFSEFLSFPVNITRAAYRIATLSNIAAAIGILGSVADSVQQNQPLLNVAFGNQRGALASIAAIALSHAATILAAHGDAIGGTTVPQSLNVTQVGGVVSSTEVPKS